MTEQTPTLSVKEDAIEQIKGLVDCFHPFPEDGNQQKIEAESDFRSHLFDTISSALTRMEEEARKDERANMVVMIENSEWIEIKKEIGNIRAFLNI